ncbi:hypothetical protein MY11210_007595 [Beauveria gryllotalpidicola]
MQRLLAGGFSRYDALVTVAFQRLRRALFAARQLPFGANYAAIMLWSLS